MNVMSKETSAKKKSVWNAEKKPLHRRILKALSGTFTLEYLNLFSLLPHSCTNTKVNLSASTSSTFIYKFIRFRRLIYIGRLSQCLHKRIKYHCSDWLNTSSDNTASRGNACWTHRLGYTFALACSQSFIVVIAFQCNVRVYTVYLHDPSGSIVQCLIVFVSTSIYYLLLFCWQNNKMLSRVA